MGFSADDGMHQSQTQTHRSRSGLPFAAGLTISQQAEGAGAMALWLKDLIAAGAVLVLAPLFAWIGLRHGRRIRGSIVLASILLGFGHAMDPPPQEKVEAAEPGKGGPQPGDPPEPDWEQ